MRRALAALVILALAPASAHASGMTTHSFMADEARQFVKTPELRRLLDANRPALLSGGAYPDGGYAASSYPGGNFGEVTHWEHFVNAYAAVLEERCADLVADCGPEVAHLMGVAAHGVGDEMWDWMFEPQAADHGESPTHPLYAQPGFAELKNLPPGSLANTMEYAMDMVAIVDHLRADDIVAYPPPVDDVLAAYKAVGRDDITRDGVLAGHSVAAGAVAAERAAAAIDYLRVKQTMPWTSAHMYDESGGVRHVATAAAGYYEALWRKLTTDAHPLPRVAAVHPARGETGVPYDWSARRTSPGPLGGGAENRIIAVLSNSIEPVALPQDAFELVDTVTGEEVPQLEGWPRSGPYHYSEGTHSMMLYPAVDLVPCRWYQAVVTRSVRDHAGAKLRRPYKWRFRTRGCAGEAGEPAGPPSPAARARALQPVHTAGAGHHR